MANSPNQTAVEKFLVENDIAFVDAELDDGWYVEVIDRIEGKQVDDLVKLVDTQQNVVIVINPSTGLTIGTEGAV